MQLFLWGEWENAFLMVLTSAVFCYLFIFLVCLFWQTLKRMLMEGSQRGPGVGKPQYLEASLKMESNSLFQSFLTGILHQQNKTSWNLSCSGWRKCFVFFVFLFWRGFFVFFFPNGITAWLDWSSQPLRKHQMLFLFYFPACRESNINFIPPHAS